jgi:death-on-curing family protein
MSKKNFKNKGEMVIYRAKDGSAKLDVELREETIWLNQIQISKLFGVNVPAISKHIRNIYKEGELLTNSTVSKMEIVQQEGGRNINRVVDFYNLDMVISIGYRVNSKRATEFRIWATQVLGKYLTKGVVVNQKRLKDKKIDFKSLEQAVKLLQNTIQSKQLKEDEAKGLLRVITEYANSWLLLNKYDSGKIKVEKGKIKGVRAINYDFTKDSIEKLRMDLIRKKQAGQLFGKENSSKLESILSSINQSFDKKQLYPSLEEKAAHLLYFIIKDHPFIDGNKRIASLLFILFLQQNNFMLNKNKEKKINDNALVALALLVAESNPKDKNVMIALITNLIR